MQALCAVGLVDEGVAVALQLLNHVIAAALFGGDRVFLVPALVHIQGAEQGELVAFVEIEHGPGHVPLGVDRGLEYLERLFVTAVAVFFCSVRQIAKQGSPAVQLGAAGDGEEGVAVFTNIRELRIVFAKTSTPATKVLCQPAFIVNLLY